MKIPMGLSPKLLQKGLHRNGWISSYTKTHFEHLENLQPAEEFFFLDATPDEPKQKIIDEVIFSL
jgi:hypothetical protein